MTTPTCLPSVTIRVISGDEQDIDAVLQLCADRQQMVLLVNKKTQRMLLANAADLLKRRQAHHPSAGSTMPKIKSSE